MRFPDPTCDQTAYDPGTIALMGRAYDEAAAEALGCGIGIGESEALQSVMAGRILSVISQGERDLTRLKLWALNALDANRFAAPAVEVPTQV